MKLRFVLFGPPASGKGTQGHRLAGEYELDYLSTGVLLRREMEKKSPLGREIADRLDQGLYVSDSIIAPLVDRWIAERETSGDGYVLDGFPRSVSQANHLADRVDFAIMLDVALPELERRVCGRLECTACHYVTTRSNRDDETCPKCTGDLAPRADDHYENFINRYREYQRHTEPLFTYYSDRKCLVRIDGLGAPHEVFARIVHALSALSLEQEAPLKASSLAG